MRGLLIGDVHLSDRPPSIRTEDYSRQILDKLWFTTELARDRTVDFVVFAGDLFHVKAPSRTSHRLVVEVLHVIEAFDMDVYIVPGNHDVRHDRLDTLGEQPLGVLFESGAAIKLVGLDDNWPIFGVPWLSNWPEQLPEYMDEWQQWDAALMVTHAPIVPPGEDRPFEVIDATTWAHLMARGGDVYYGHMHDADGAYEVAPDGHNQPFIFCNQGALSRGSIHESSLARKPAVTIYDDSKEGLERFERIEVSHLPAAEVFRLGEKEVEDSRVERLDVFLDSLAETRLSVMSVEKILADLEGRDLDEATRREVVECLESVL